MNKWFPCKRHGGYFPPTTKIEHELRMCKECIKEEEKEKNHVINQYMRLQ